MKLFISFSTADKWQVRQLADLFQTAGHKPWYSAASLLPGQDWQQAILQAIQNADAFVYAMSPEAIQSAWCQWELRTAIQLAKPIIPVLLQAQTDLLQAKTNIPEVLRPYQYADLSEGLSPNAIAQLMGGLLEIAVNIPPEQAPPAPENPDGIPPQAA